MNAWYEIVGTPNNRNRFEAKVSVDGEVYYGIHVDAMNAFEQALCKMPDEVLNKYLDWHMRNHARYVGFGSYILEIDVFNISGYIGPINLSIWTECPLVSSRPWQVQRGRRLSDIGDETAQKQELENICENYIKQKIIEKRKYM